MHVSQNGRDLIAFFEGFKPTAYRCPAGVPTIGFGHTDSVKPSDVGVKKISRDEADCLLSDDLEEVETRIKQLVKVPLNQDQFDALSSFTFNLGSKALASSTLLMKLNQGEYAAVPQQLARWNKANGKILSGLVLRREAEGKLWNGKDWR